MLFFTKKEIIARRAFLNFITLLIKRGRRLAAENFTHKLLWLLKIKIKKFNLQTHTDILNYILVRLQVCFRMITSYPTLSTLIKIPVPANMHQRESYASRIFIAAMTTTRKKIDLNQACDIIIETCAGRSNLALKLKAEYITEALENSQNIRYLKFKGSWWMSSEKIK